MTTKTYKVYSGTMYNPNPRIVLSNKLLAQYGFGEGNNIEVTFEDGKITITNIVRQSVVSVESAKCAECRMAKFCISHNSDRCPLAK